MTMGRILYDSFHSRLRTVFVELTNLAVLFQWLISDDDFLNLPLQRLNNSMRTWHRQYPQTAHAAAIQKINKHCSAYMRLSISQATPRLEKSILMFILCV